MIVKKSYKILLNIFILSYLLIIKIQCLKFNIGKIKYFKYLNNFFKQ